MKKYLSVALGILTAIGGFVDIGDLVTNAQVGARFGMSLAWITIGGVVGICVFAEMSGRVAAISGRPTFDLIRERLGPRLGLLNLTGSMAVTMLTFVAEIGGVALSLQLITSVNEVLIVPAVGFVVWLILWRARFSVMENVLGLLGLALIVFAVALVALGPDWRGLAHQWTTFDKPGDEAW
ncbi:Natural resistance-associated macrophage protein [Nocardioides terrae]|uniref:Natural resistance-associated macrophage protein n=1 Tax=Nocardioides terrae TaxID=574651 RepID=A0A1I1MRC5_9ACTN|nr:Natural resistance-associated macrophage protein [Nocardioides terrae]